MEFNNLFDLLEIEDANPKSRRNCTEEVAVPVEISEEEKEQSGKENVPNYTPKPKKVKSGKRKGKSRKPLKPQKAIVKKSTDTDDELEFLANEMDAEDEEDELYFMIYCFFKDFNYLREYIQERWCDYQEGLLSLSAVSVTTNTTFELLQRSEKELLSQIPASSGLGNYKAMADLLFFERGLAHVDYDEKAAMFDGDPDGMSDAIHDEADFICLPTFWTLTDWLRNCPPRKIPTLGHLIGTTPDYQAQASHGRLDRDKQILQEILQECCLIKAFKNDPGFMLPGEDELTIGLIHMLATRKIPIWLILASQLFCDIRSILETEVSHCHDELLRMGNRVDSILKHYIDFAKDFDVPISSVLYTTVSEVECWITKDFAEPMRTKMHLEHGHPKSSIEQYHYLRRHPLLCGLMIFRFSLTMNELGLKNSNMWGATIAAAHLYNAVRHELSDFPQWLDVEALILIHTRQRIFWRDILPSTPAQYSRCYERATGVGDMIAQRKAGGAMHIMPKAVKDRGIAPIPGVSAEYWERMCFARREQMKTLPDVEKVLNSIAENEMQHSLAGLRLLGTGTTEISLPAAEASLEPLAQARALENRPHIAQSSSSRALTSQFQKTRTLTNVQLVDVLVTRISQESYALNFDYFSLHERCMLLLKAVYEEFKKEIIERDDELDWGRAELPVLPHWLFEMLQDDKMKGDVLLRLEKAMEPIVKEQGSHEILRVREFLGGGMVESNGRRMLG